MSSVVISGNTSGTVTLFAPDVSGTTVLTLPTSNGTVLTTNTSGIASVNGIQFPATQVASTNANTLDDYEEGTWTPSWSASSGSMSYSARVATYTKVGKLVLATCHIITNANNSLSGNVLLNGLPFTADSTSNNYMAVPVHVEQVNLSASAWIWAYVIPGTTQCAMRYWINNAAAGNLQGSNLNAGSDIMVTCTYMADV